jgi:hypothetical protein
MSPAARKVPKAVYCTGIRYAMAQHFRTFRMDWIATRTPTVAQSSLAEFKGLRAFLAQDGCAAAPGAHAHSA